MKIASFILSSLFLFQGLSIHLGTLSQYKELVEHIQFHKEKYGENISMFFAKHYGSLQDEHTSDNPDEKNAHEKLPFHNNQHTTTSIVIAVNMPHKVVDLKASLASLKLAVNLQKKYVSPLLDGLLQPPRLV